MKLKLPKINMANMSLKKVPHMVKAFATNNAPELAAGGAILALIGTVYVTIKCYDKYQKGLAQAELEKNEEFLKKAQEEKAKEPTDADVDDEDYGKDAKADAEQKPEYVNLTKRDKAKVAARTFWPCLLIVLTSAGLMIASVKFSHKQLKAAMIAATMAETALYEKENALKGLLTPKQETELKMKENEAMLQKYPAPWDDTLIERSSLLGDTLFFDPLLKRHFYSSIDLIKNAIIDMKEEILDTGGLDINSYCGYLGIAQMGESFDEVGWEFDRTGNIKCELEYKKEVNGDSDRQIVILKHKTLPQGLIGAGHFSKW